MPSERYFIDQSLEPEALCEVKESEFHHLVHVMRSEVGDRIEIVNGRGVLAHASVEAISKRKADLRIESVRQEQKKVCIILAQAIPKSNRLDFIIEKGTELGVDRFLLFPGMLSQKKEMFPNQLERARHLAISAMKQCGRLTLPEICLQPPLEAWKPLDTSSSFFGDVNPNAPLLKNVLKTIPSTILPILFLTGPESGFDDREIEILQKLGAQGVKLHRDILRTDTASLAAISLISHWML